jgi:hypothetical protein
MALNAGVDVSALIRKLGLPSNGMLDRAGTFAIAYGIHKILLPIRLLLTVAITRSIRKCFPRV